MCNCARVCIDMRLYKRMFVCVCVWGGVCVCALLHLLYSSMHGVPGIILKNCRCVRMCVYVRLYKSVCLRVCVFFYISESVCLHVCVSFYISESACLHVCVPF